MVNYRQTLFLIFILVSMPLSGCIDASEDSPELKGETLAEVENPCLQPSQSITQSVTSILVDGEERLFRLSVPSSDAGTKLAVIIAFHGGGGAEEDFDQQNQFDQLGEQEKFIMAYAIADGDRTPAEGDWFLNTAATSRDDNDFSESIIDELSKAYCIDDDRLYAIGYSLGSMYTYEIACQLNGRFAAVASFAGTMPVSPETCNLGGSIAVMHIHGKLDYIIDYDEDWDWKDGEMEGVGTMSNIPGMIDYWAQKSNCQNANTHAHLFDGDEVEHIVHSDCDGDVRIEHYGMEAQEHSWPNEVDGTATYQLMWDFLSDFTN
ncbi:alpha/beta hydrolase-fold protein [Candidatus Poseidoniaceae archaeon]|jgi:polyhydroxybutyrate depolymerase|nr:alpha/beta hydrolase-fold protein [Candidatus Poseidoniaceae archaeon]